MQHNSNQREEPRIEAESAALKNLLILSGAGVALLFGIFILVGDFEYGAKIFHGGIVVALAVIFIAVLLKRLVAEKGVILTIGPDGFTDRRLCEQTIPWNAIKGVSTWQSRGQKLLVLDVSPEFEASLPLSAYRRAVISVNRAFGVKGIAISPYGVKASLTDMLDTANYYLRQDAS